MTVRFGALTAVDGVSFAVEPGEVFGFLGPNGAGKTMTLRVLLDLLRPDAGRARVLGQEVRAGGGPLRARMGFLPGDLTLFPDLTAVECLDLLAALQGRPAARRAEVLGRLGFPPAAHARKVGACSTGMRQMLGIAAALQHDPDVLVLDEPTTGLDPTVRNAFLGLVRDEAARGHAVLLSSHVLDEVERCADRVAFLAHGRVHLVESVAELRARRPRVVRLRGPDGTEESFTTTEPPAALLARLAGRELLDLEVRPANLEEVFRDVIGRAGPARPGDAG